MTAQHESLPEERAAVTHKFEIAEHEGYVTVGFYHDGRIGEVQIVMGNRMGEPLRALVDAVSASVSIAIQHGVPLDIFVDKFKFTRFEPAGFTGNKDVPNSSSILDYVFKWIENRFPGGKKSVDDWKLSGVEDSPTNEPAEQPEKNEGE